MVRTVKAKTAHALKKDQQAVLLPGLTKAEPWELWVVDAQGAAECVQVSSSPLNHHLGRNTTLALPVAQVFCLPLWLNETDPKQFGTMISLQLESRGLQPRGDETAVFDWTVITREGPRTLVMVGVLPASPAEEIQAEGYNLFDLSARFLMLPENSLTLWREQDRLVFAITRGRDLVYYQALGEEEITGHVLQDLTCALTSLSTQGVLTPLQQVMVWTDIGGATAIAALQAALQLPIQQSARSSPMVPSTAWNLRPTAVDAAKRAREAKRWQWRGGFIVLAIYLMLIGWLVSQYLLVSSRVDELRQWQAQHAKTLAMVHDTQAAWRDLRPLVDENNYPLELLLHTAEMIPENQLHLTLFEANDGHLRIKAEAKDFGAASKFEESLKNNPHIPGYTWDMGQPHLLPNDLAQLQITGSRGATN